MNCSHHNEEEEEEEEGGGGIDDVLFYVVSQSVSAHSSSIFFLKNKLSTSLAVQPESRLVLVLTRIYTSKGEEEKEEVTPPSIFHQSSFHFCFKQFIATVCQRKKERFGRNKSVFLNDDIISFCNPRIGTLLFFDIPTAAVAGN